MPCVAYTTKQMWKVSHCLRLAWETVFCTRHPQTSVILPNIIPNECHHIFIGTIRKLLRQRDDLVKKESFSFPYINPNSAVVFVLHKGRKMNV